MRLKIAQIETKRLILRPFILEDVPSVFYNWASDPETTKYMSWPTHRTLEDSEAYVRYTMEANRNGDACEWAITIKASGEVIGSLGASLKNEHTGVVNSGYIISKKYWRQGYTSEAYGAAIDFLFRENQVNRIEAYHDPNNPGSGAVMRKCGLTYEGTLRKSDMNNTGICDAAWYGILKEEYL